MNKSQIAKKTKNKYLINRVVAESIRFLKEGLSLQNFFKYLRNKVINTIATAKIIQAYAAASPISTSRIPFWNAMKRVILMTVLTSGSHYIHFIDKFVGIHETYNKGNSDDFFE